MELLKNPAQPVVQFAAYGEPLTKDQMEALAMPQDIPEPTIKPPPAKK
ncbi:MAG: hypothetical protein PHS86_06115 [Syntrophaceae bacterium]|nr:hypothetical protein [Syntrophaceae bacterium]